MVDAFRKSIDQMYAEFRQTAEVDVEIRDLVAVDQTPRRSVCKAVMRIAITYFGIRKQEDTVVTFVAEATEKGDVVVTVVRPNSPAR